MTNRTGSCGARLAHVSLVAENWESLASFFREVFGCLPIPPERDLHGTWLEQATGVPGARIRGIHLRFPGDEADGPTLEIFQYDPAETSRERSINRPGFAHMAVAVHSVEAASEAVRKNGGSAVGPITRRSIRTAGTITFQYVRDPEGNVIELQHWEAVEAPA